MVRLGRVKAELAKSFKLPLTAQFAGRDDSTLDPGELRVIVTLRKLLVIAATGLSLAGITACSQLSMEPTRTPNVPAPDPNGYPWENESVQGSGRGGAPKNTQSAQRDLAARNSARVAALRDLQMQMRQLPVGTDHTIGSIMDNYLNVRRAIEKQMQRAETLSEVKVGPSEYEVHLKAPLSPIAQILKQSYITPNNELPKPPVQQAGGALPLS
jgi:hypothetical protein